MDIRLLDVLRLAPSIDLYELSIAKTQMLNDPRRILEVRRYLHLNYSARGKPKALDGPSTGASHAARHHFTVTA